MPTQWSGTFEDRFKRLDENERRCDGLNRHCTRNAVEEYDLLPADGNFVPLPDAQMVKKKSCGYHRREFLQNGRWSVLATRDLPGRFPQSGDQRSRRAS